MRRLHHLPSWRVRTGTGLFLLGLVLPAFIPLIYLVGITGWPAAILTALFALGLPEAIWVASALVIGRDGFRALKREAWLRWKWFVRRITRR
jgi:hypothetical protein